MLLGLLHNNLEHIRKHPRRITHFRSYDVTSGRVTFGHATFGSHVTSDHEQWYILYYYYSKKKNPEIDVTSCDRHFQSVPLPVAPPRSTSWNVALSVLVYYFCDSLQIPENNLMFPEFRCFIIPNSSSSSSVASLRISTKENNVKVLFFDHKRIENFRNVC